VAHGDIFPLNAAREPFFVKMWPAYETEFETPGLIDGGHALMWLFLTPLFAHRCHVLFERTETSTTTASTTTTTTKVIKCFHTKIHCFVIFCVLEKKFKLFDLKFEPI
jgi:hypothetical protein